MPYDQKWAEGLIKGASGSAGSINLINPAGPGASQFYDVVGKSARLKEMAKKKILELSQIPLRDLTMPKTGRGAFATEEAAEQGGKNFAENQRQKKGLLEHITPKPR